MKCLFPFIAVCLVSACSLDYGKSVNVEDAVPEFRFTDAHFSRYEDNKATMEIAAERIEQYKSDGSSYARKAVFKSYGDDGELKTEGTCNFLSADTKKELYIMFDDISLLLHSQDMKVFADALKYDGNNEQITSGRDDEVSVEKKDTVITGRGFSASGVSKTFSFLTQVTGDITTSDDGDDSAPNADEAPRGEPGNE